MKIRENKENRILIPKTRLQRELLAKKLFVFFGVSFSLYVVAIGYNLSQVLVRSQYSEMTKVAMSENNALESRYYTYLRSINDDTIVQHGLVEAKVVHYAEIDSVALLTEE